MVVLQLDRKIDIRAIVVETVLIKGVDRAAAISSPQ